MKNYIGILMLILGAGAYASNTATMDVPVRANLVKPLVAKADGDFYGQIFKDETSPSKSGVTLSVTGKGNETVEVRLNKNIKLQDGPKEVDYTFDFNGSTEDIVSGDTMKVGHLVLDGSGAASLLIEGAPIYQGADFEVGNYTGSVEVNIKYL